VSKDKVVLACSTDISSSAFAQVVEVGSGGKACGMAVVTTPEADAGSLLLSTTTQTSPESPAPIPASRSQPPPASRRTNQIKCAVVSYISTPNFLNCLKVLVHTVQKSTSYPMVVALSTDMAAKTRAEVRSKLSGTTIIDIEQVQNPNAKVSIPHFAKNYAVLRMWSLVAYQRVVVIDADMLVTQSLDELCEMDLPATAVAAANNWWTSKREWDQTVFNGGLMVLRPSLNLYNQLLESSKTFKSPSGGAQPFLNHFFNGKNWVRLDAKSWGMNANAYRLQPATWTDSKIHAIHYTTEAKPCHTSPGAFIDKPENHPYRQWHQAYHEMIFKEQQNKKKLYNADVMPNRKACIVYLLTFESGPTGKNYVKLIKQSIRSLEQYFFSVARYPVCILHSKDVDAKIMADVASETKSTVVAYEIEFRYPLHKEETYKKNTPKASQCKSSYNPNKEWHINYLHMCHFYTYDIFYSPVFREFDWLFRLDADSGLDMNIPCDPFGIMEANNASFGYYKKEKQGGGCAAGFHGKVMKEFVPKAKASLLFPVEPNDVFLGAFHIFKTSFFTKPSMMQFWDWVDLSSVGYETRTGEQAVVPYALAFNAKPEQLQQFAGYGLWHRMESNKLWRDRLKLPTGCPQKELGESNNLATAPSGLRKY